MVVAAPNYGNDVVSRTDFIKAPPVAQATKASAQHLCHHAMLDADPGAICVGTRRPAALTDRHTTQRRPNAKGRGPIPLPLHGPQQMDSPLSARLTVADPAA
jgi:hypothetical protein